MKMEIPVEAPIDGVVAEILVAEGDQVSEDDVIALVDGALVDGD
jgi:biotin carboxyl carrier protein